MNATEVIQNTNCNSSNFSSNLTLEDKRDEVYFKSHLALKITFAAIAGLSTIANTCLCVVLLKRKRMLRKNYNMLILNLAVADALTATKATIIKTTFGLIAILSFMGNLFLCIVMIRKRSMLKKAYNVLIFNLAVADMLTGIFIVATPDYVFDRRTFPNPDGLAGEIYCRLIGSTYILFIFSKASTLTIMFLAIDRWYSIIKPIMYKTTFSRRRLYVYITIIWIISCVTQINELFITVVEDGFCTFKVPFYGVKFERILILVHVTLTFYIPSIITWCSFTHIKYHMNKPRFRRSINNVKATERLLRMCALAAFFLSICWLPTETFFITYKFDVLRLPFSVSLFLSVLAMFNSCVNPWIYCLSNKEYRKEFINLLCCVRSSSVGLTELIARVSSSQSQYSFTNVLTLPNDNQTNFNTEWLNVFEMRAMSNPETMFLDFAPNGATLKRYSRSDLLPDLSANDQAHSHVKDKKSS